MKLRNMTSLIAKAVTVFSACAALNAAAGTSAPAKEPVPVESKPESLFNSIGATFDAGYDSRYYFRGLWFADNIMWGALNLAIPLISGSGEDGSGSLTWGLGGVYINTAGTPWNNPLTGAYSKSGFQYSEIDAITNLTYDAGWAKFGMQYQYYFYPDNYGGSFNGVPNAGTDPEFALKGAGELGWTVAIPVQGFNFYAGYYYDFRIAGQYIQMGVDYTIPVNDWLSIVPSVNVGYGIDYYTGNGASSNLGSTMVRWNGQPLGPKSGFTHVLYSIAAPIKLTNSVTLTTYVALNESERLRTGLNATRNEIWWGTKLSFSF